jgi:hypothetical protein
VVTASNVQGLTSLTPDQFLSGAAAATGKPDGYWSFGALGVLSSVAVPYSASPFALDQSFHTPRSVSAITRG